jgi:predicted pyridoxine 5'-phosphate oxidase superfamily flavin-nucleotide-binding protein
MTTTRSPFHTGEQIVQRRVGVREQVERAGRNMIRDHMPEQHRQLFEALPLLGVGSVDASGRPWASLLCGKPGFVRSPSPKLLQVQAQPVRGDPLAEQLRIGSALGLLGIQLETRRRNRANGHIVGRDEGSFSVDIEQSFGNCKQYIQARQPTFDEDLLGRARAPQDEGPRLSARARELLAATDTLFIATASREPESGKDGEGVDVSHRGGRPGFVRVSDAAPDSAPDTAPAARLTIPDFRGNFIFNTFGNLELNPRAGIICADFDTGDLLSLTGNAHVIWDGPELASFAGADRLLSFDVQTGVLLEGALPLHFEGLVPSPDLAKTGIWPEPNRR